MVEVLKGSQTAVAEADIRLITGDQRSGKSNTGVALAIDDSVKQMDKLITPTGEFIKAQALTKEDRKYLMNMGVMPGMHKYAKVFSDDGKQSKIIKIPNDYLIGSPVKIFANFHIYGIANFAFISLVDILQYMNTELFNDAWILSDESVMTDARNSMEAGGKLVAIWGATMGKRNAKLCFMVQYASQIELRFRLFAKTRIECTYDKVRKLITVEVKKAGQSTFSYDYYAPNYWRFYDTNELPQVPQEKIDRALAKYYSRK